MKPSVGRLVLFVLGSVAPNLAFAQPLDAVRQVNSPEALGQLVARAFPQLILQPTAKSVPDEIVRLVRYESRGGSIGWSESNTRFHTSLTHRQDFTIYRTQWNGATTVAEGEISTTTNTIEGVQLLGGLAGINMPNQPYPGWLSRIVAVNGDPRKLAPGARFEIVSESRYPEGNGRESVSTTAATFSVDSVEEGPLPGVPIPGRIAVMDVTSKVVGGTDVYRSRYYFSLDFGAAVRTEILEFPSSSHAARSRSEDRLVGVRVSGRYFGQDRSMADATVARRVSAMQGMLRNRGAVPPFSDLSDLAITLDPASANDLTTAIRGTAPPAAQSQPVTTQALADRQPSPPVSQSLPRPTVPPTGPLPSTAVALRDATTECDCTRKLGRCEVTSSVRDTQISRVSNGLSSLVIVRLEPPPNQCVEATVYLRERAIIGDRPRSTGHPIYRVIDGPTDVEWRNVGTPASELNYSIAPSETECYVCRKKVEAKNEVPQAAFQAPGRGPFFHASIMSPTQRRITTAFGEVDQWGSHLAIGLSAKSAEEARRRACHWPTGAGGVSQEACMRETLTESFGPQANPTTGGHIQQVLKCGGGAYFAIARSAGAVGVACGAQNRERAEMGALDACRKGWAEMGLPDGGGKPSLSPNSPSVCHVAYSAVNDGKFAAGEGFGGFNEGGNGLWTYCWGNQRKHFDPTAEQGCAAIIKSCSANPSECR